MRLRFEKPELKRLYEKADYRPRRVGPDLAKSFRRKVALLAAARDERDVRAVKSLHLEKLRGSRSDQQSIRLNDQWRLVIRFETDDGGAVVAVIGIVDYHP